jgi:hypothetical protein
MAHTNDPRPQQQRPPLPDNEDEKRRAHSRLRRRIIEGWWRRDLDERVAEFFAEGTAARLGYRDQTRNLFRSIVDQMSRLYGKPPTIEHADANEDKVADFSNKLRAAELWPVLGRNQRQVVGMRESLVRVAYVPDDGLQFRVVPSDMVWAAATPDRPNDPSAIIEARIRTLTIKGKEEARWTWDVLDIRDEPSYRVVLPDGARLDKATDITEQVLGGDFSGSAYPYVVDSKPVIPYVLYHAEGGGDSLWDAYTGKEMVEATLTVATLWTFWNYCVRDASHPIRGLANGIIRGTATKGGNRSSRREVAADPTTMLMIDSEGAGSVQALQWSAGSDPSNLQLAIDAYEQRSLISAGISPADIQQTGSQSGYAISLKREAVRERQQALMPQMEAGDRRVLALAASLCNRYEGESFPDVGWNLRYSQIPLTTDERTARIAEARAGLELGTRSIVDVVIAENPGWTRDEAASWLERVQAESAALRGVSVTTGVEEQAEGGEDEAGDVAETESAPAEEKLADTALNGAQVVAAMTIVQSVAEGTLPRDAGLSMLSEFFNLPRDAAERIMGSVGRGFRPAQPEQSAGGEQ